MEKEGEKVCGEEPLCSATNEIRVTVEGETLRVVHWDKTSVVTKVGTYLLKSVSNLFIHHGKWNDKLHYICPGSGTTFEKIRWLTGYNIEWLERRNDVVGHLRKRYKSALKHKPDRIFGHHFASDKELIEYVKSNNIGITKEIEQDKNSEESLNNSPTPDEDERDERANHRLKELLDSLDRLMEQAPDAWGWRLEEVGEIMRPNVYRRIYRIVLDNPYSMAFNLQVKKILDDLRMEGFIDIAADDLISIKVSDYEYLRILQTEECGTMRALCYSMLAHQTELQRMANMLNYRMSKSDTKKHLPALTAKEWCRVAMLDEVGWKDLYVFYIHSVKGISFVARTIYGSVTAMMKKLFHWRRSIEVSDDQTRLIELAKDERDVFALIKQA